MSYLVIGGDGLIGARLLGKLKAGHAPVAATTRRRPVPEGFMPLDLSEPQRLRFQGRCEVAILAAAITAIQSCESDPAGTRTVNVDGIVSLARELHGNGAFLVFLSTNAVFDGEIPRPRFDSPRRPRTEYGRQKMDVEDILLGMGGTAVIRMTKVLSATTPLVAGWMSQLAAGREIRPFSDLRFSPVSVEHASSRILDVAQGRADGVHHLSGRDDVSYAQFAEALAAAMKADPKLVRPVDAGSAGVSLAYQPRHSSLDGESSSGAMHMPGQPLEGVISDLLKESGPNAHG